MIARSRFDALTDGVFAVAMTLLVLEVRIADDITAATPAAVVAALAALRGKILIYGLSFAVLGLVWMARASLRPRPEAMSRTEALFGLASLFLVTIMPFSSMAIGRFDTIPEAIWIYCANLALLALFSALMRGAQTARGFDWRATLHGPSLLLVGSAALASLFALVDVDRCLWLLAFNALGPFMTGRRSAKAN